MVSVWLTYFLDGKGDIVKKSIEAFNRLPWYLQVILGLVGLAVAVALA
ncbi:amino acid ABC transporter permease, partial [Streptococcus thermophilus]